MKFVLFFLLLLGGVSAFAAEVAEEVAPAPDTEDSAPPPPPPPLRPPPIEQTEDYVFSPARIAVWLENFRTRAIEAGVEGAFFDRAFENFKPTRGVVRAANNQPETKFKPGAYVFKLVSPARLEQGRALLHQHAHLLEKIERLYGVDRHILIAIWGIETNFGKTQGTHNVLYALATLALEGRRKQFAESQLLALLPVLEKDDLPLNITGSWAGAMGQMQFIPTTYADYARDVDGNGKRDIWNSLADSLGSAAYYLKRSGWRAGAPWGIEVETPEGYSFEERDRDEEQSIEDWIDDGYVPANGTDARHRFWLEEDAKLVHVAPHAPAFLATKNFKALLKYNNASVYALAVGRLADRLRGAAQTKTAWLEVPLENFTKAEIKQMQLSLNGLGFAAGGADGLIGDKTRTAFAAWQTSLKQPTTKITSTQVALLHKQATAIPLTGEQVKRLQENLTQLGFAAGVADGVAGNKTYRALRAFQTAAGLPITGEPSRAMLWAVGEQIKTPKNIPKNINGEEGKADDTLETK